MQQEKETRRSIIVWLYIVLFTALSGFLLWKCRFGYASNDEAFYLTIPYRLYQGDGLLVHEWHLSQLSGFLLYPAVSVYLWITNSTEGMLLSFRYIFTIAWMLSALFVFLRLRSVSLYGAMLASLFFLLYAPFGIMALSYNSMGIMLLLSACLILTTAKRRIPLQQCAAGVLFAGAVMCCPHLAILYGLFTIAAALLFRKKKQIGSAWLMITLGSLLLLAVFLLFLLNRASAAELFRAFPQLFHDPEHAAVPLREKNHLYFDKLFHCNQRFPLGCLLGAGILAASRFIKDKLVGLAAMIVVIMALQMEFLTKKPYINFVMFSINLIAPYCVLYSGAKEVKLLFWGVWVPGAVYTYCICLGSNQAFYAISSASTVMMAASVAMLGCFLSNELRQRKPGLFSRIVLVLMVLLMGLQFWSELSLRYSFVYSEPEGMPAQTVRAESGPEKGIIMTQEKLEHYLMTEEDLRMIREDKAITGLLTLSKDPYLYLGAGKKLSTYSGWLSGINGTSIARLETYFTLNPEKRPDAIYVEEQYGEYVELYKEQGYLCRQLESGAYLLTMTQSAASSTPTSNPLPHRTGKGFPLPLDLILETIQEGVTPS